VIAKSFPVKVEGIGEFVFRKRRVKDQVWIESDAAATFNGPQPIQPVVPDDPAEWSKEEKASINSYVASISLWSIGLEIATIERLLVKAPSGWSLDDIDPLDAAQLEPARAVYRSLREAEDRFRAGGGQNSAESGA
jgi:hypothetical protein